MIEKIIEKKKKKLVNLDSIKVDKYLLFDNSVFQNLVRFQTSNLKDLTSTTFTVNAV